MPAFDHNLEHEPRSGLPRRHDAPFVVDQRIQWLNRDMTVDEDEQSEPVQQRDEESDDGGCCCCWPFSLFCRC